MSTAAASPALELADAPARKAIRESLGETLIVEAAAGTGKTTELVARIAAVLESGTGTLDRVVAVTFTEKAAGELKLRLRAEIERARQACAPGSAPRARLDRALGELELAHIGTIHAFCADLLRSRPLEAGVDPLFEVMAEDVQQAAIDEVFRAWFERVLGDPPEGVRRVLRRRPRWFDASGPREDLAQAVRVLLEHRDFPAAWRREPFARAARIGAVIDALREIAAWAPRASRANDYLAQNLAEIARFLFELDHREAVRGRDLDGLEAELRELSRTRSVHWHWRGSPRQPYGPGLERASVIAQRDRAHELLLQLVSDADADLAPLLQSELQPVLDAYRALKQRTGRLDFLDLLLRARNLVRDSETACADLQQRFTHYFVDEFQDTDPLQAELLLRLCAQGPCAQDWRQIAPLTGKLFLVGDPKQSIYRFRRADVELYEAIKRALVARGARLVELSTSFRSAPSIQSAVNAAFAPLMAGEPGGVQARYVPLAPFRAESDRQPAIVALPVPRPYGDYGQIVRWRIEESLPDAVGAFVDWLVSRSGWTVEDRDRPGQRVAVQPRHVCLLFRRFRRFRDDVTRPYVRALEVRRIPHVLVGGRSFHDREEVLALRNALVAIEWPDDELRVYAALRGPLFSLGDDALLGYRHRHGALHPLRPDPAELGGSDREVADALAVLRELHVHRNRRAIATTIAELLAAVRAHAAIAIWPTGEQALANCLRLVDLARRFERGGAPSFRAFVEQLEDDAEAGETEEAPAVEEGTEGVRIMTAHRAKGLEFAVVILVDPTCRAARELPTRYTDPDRELCAEPLCGCAPRELLEQQAIESERDRAEAVRLAYVAATRARDLLVVPVVGDAWLPDGQPLGASGAALGAGMAGAGTAGAPASLAEDAGWLDVLHPVVYPERAARRAGARAPGSPSFEGDSVLERPDSARVGAGGAVAPGLHVPQLGTHRVVWWDPRALELDREWSVGLRQQRILEADEGETASQRGAEAHRAWQAERERRLSSGGAASLSVVTATARAAAAEPAAADAAGLPPVTVETVAGARDGRPGGRRFGSLVHAVLAAVDLGASDRAAVERCARTQGRLLGASETEVQAAASAAHAALAHPLLQRAAASASVRRETAVLWAPPDGGLIEGVVDLAFREERGGAAQWTVVDFKTDRELGAQRAVYEAQVRIYARAIAAATAESAQAVLLIV